MAQSKQQTKAGPKPSRAITTSCSTMSGIQGLWYDLSSKGLRHLQSYGLASCSPLGHSLGLVPFIACGFPQQIASPTSWGLPCDFDFTCPASHIVLSQAASRDPNPGTHWLASKAFLWNLGGSLHNSCLLHTCKTKMMWTTPMSVSNSGSIPTSLNQSCSGPQST
jgi:hypothetical protein